MTRVANIRCWDMLRRLAGCRNSIVAADAGTYYFIVIHRRRGYRRPACRERLMTGIAQRRTIDMRGILAAGGHAVMACDTTACRKIRVVRRATGAAACRSPRGGRMATVAFRGRWNMRWAFARCHYIVVATRTQPQYLIMVYGAGRNRRPWRGPRRMTSITSIRGINMIQTFTRCDTIVVATDTSACYRIMIHR
jgi:hypothetical protein